MTTSIATGASLGAQDRERPERRIVALGVLTIALYWGTWLLERSIVRNGVVAPSSILDPGHAANPTLLVWQMALYVAVTVMTFWAYGAVLSMAWRGALDHGRARLWALVVPVLLNLSFLAWMPRLSEDVLSYLGHGLLALVPGDNPLLQPVEVARNTVHGAKLAALGWNTSAGIGITPYGILWTRLEVVVAKLCDGNVFVAVVLFKAVAIAASLGSAWMTWIALGRIRPGLQLQGTLAYLWNPLILMEFGGEGHNDALMIFFSIAALAACVASKPAISIIAQLLGALSKYLTVLFLPAQLVYLWWSRRSMRRLALEIVIAIAIAGVIATVLYAPLWVGLRSFQGMVKRASPVSSATIFGVIDWVLRRSPLRSASGPLTIAAVSVPYVAFVVWTSLRVKDAASLARACAWISLGYLLVVSPDYWPWYACMPVAWIFVGDLDRLFWLAILMSVSGRLTAPLEALHDHGYMSIQVSKGLTTGFGSLLPLIALAIWVWVKWGRGSSRTLAGAVTDRVD